MNETLLGKEIIMIIEIFGKKWWKQKPGTEYNLINTLKNIERCTEFALFEILIIYAL